MERLFAVGDVVVGPRPALSHGVLGRIAELKAEARLLELGHKVADPGIDDDGVDLVVDYRLAIQVKSSAGLVSRSDGSPRWEFEFRTGRKNGLRDASNAERLKDRSHVAFVLMYARDVDIWWVVPSSEHSGAARIRIVPGGVADLCWREAWHLLREGAS